LQVIADRQVGTKWRQQAANQATSEDAAMRRLRVSVKG